MKMTAEEILEMYNADRSRETMEIIAAMNDCTIKEVGEFLKKAAKEQPKKKPGRKPKSEKAESGNLCSTEDTKSHDTEEVTIKEQPHEDKMHRGSYLIPEVVVGLTRDKIKEYKRMADFHAQKMEEYNLLALECEDFLQGGFCNGEKDGIFGQV